MISINNVQKKFEKSVAVNNISFNIPDGSILGIIGENGAGKSTLLRMISGIYKADQGTIEIDGQLVYNNAVAKSEVVFVPDDLYFIMGSSINRMAKAYSAVYPKFDYNKLNNLVQTFKLNPNANINTFSKGMKRQAAIILALSCNTKYIILDETYDGLDPIMRTVVKRILCDDVISRNATAIISSHSLRELEDTCDQVVLLHHGGVVFESDITNLKTQNYKVQIAFNGEVDETFGGVKIISKQLKGSIYFLVVQGDKDEVQSKLEALNPTVLDILPLTLEEVFTYELSSLGYGFENIVKEEQ